jgi:hypothetical protein
MMQRATGVRLCANQHQHHVVDQQQRAHQHSPNDGPRSSLPRSRVQRPTRHGLCY